MSEDELLYEVTDGIGTITFNRPQSRNALTFAMYERLSDLCANAPTDGSVKAIIITGAGEKAFAAGTDIAQFRDFGTPEQGIEYERNAELTFASIDQCPVPTIAAIAGACTGGGAGIAAVCDLRIASADLKYGFPIARTLGNLLSAATLSRLVGLMGEAKLLDIMLTSRLIEAEEALAIGMVNEVLPDHAALMNRAQELARRIAGNAPLTMRATKTLLRRLRETQPRVDDDDIVGEVYSSVDFREGLESFLAKRKPQWQGR
ncbi:MAG: enoyl-CoA hydratase [Gammaproteobacteria bacterium]|jgi:enoyl-CoA hydratase